jgi:hypothetical protein
MIGRSERICIKLIIKNPSMTRMGYKLLKILIGLQVILLFVQFWLGMNLNLFVAVPLKSPQNFSSYSGGYELLAHIVIGVTIFVLAGLLLSYGSRLRSRYLSALSVFGLVFAIIAPATGVTFTLSGQDNSLSLAMAMSFLIAFAVYLSGFYLVDKLRAAGRGFR